MVNRNLSNIRNSFFALYYLRCQIGGFFKRENISSSKIYFNVLEKNLNLRIRKLLPVIQPKVKYYQNKLCGTTMSVK